MTGARAQATAHDAQARDGHGCVDRRKIRRRMKRVRAGRRRLQKIEQENLRRICRREEEMSEATGTATQTVTRDPLPHRRGQPPVGAETIGAALLRNRIPDARAGEEPQRTPHVPPGRCGHGVQDQAPALRRGIDHCWSEASPARNEWRDRVGRFGASARRWANPERLPGGARGHSVRLGGATAPMADTLSFGELPSRKTLSDLRDTLRAFLTLLERR